MKKDEIITKAYELFSSYNRPDHFTDYTHCYECDDHDKTMRCCELREIGPEEVGHPCWSPLPFLTEDALGYVMPRLIEMAVNLESNKDGDNFLFDFLICVTPAEDYDRFKGYSLEQREIVSSAIHYIKDNLFAQVKENFFEEELENAVKMWDKKCR